MWDFFKSDAEDSSYVEPAIVILKIIALDDFSACANEFYGRLPKFIALQKPPFDKLLDTIIYRVSFAIMNPQVLERFGGMLPIERDSAGYFFVSTELKELKNNAPQSVSSGLKKDSIHQILKGQLETGLLALRNLSIFRYLAVSAKQNRACNLQGTITQVSEALSVLSRSEKMRDRYAREARTENFTGEIIEYEKNVLPRLILAAQILQSLYFDLNNFFLGRFSDEMLERVVKEAVGDGYPKDSIGGYFPVLMNERVYAIAKKKKIEYVEYTRDAFRRRLYAPLALLLFRQNLASDSGFPAEVLKSLNKLKLDEFLRYNESLDYHGYCDSMRLKKDVRSFIAPIMKEIPAYCDDPSMAARFIGLFSSLETQEKSIVKNLMDKQALDVFRQAWRYQWQHVLAANVRMFAEIAKDIKLTQLLLSQKTEALFLMLNNLSFRSYLKQVDTRVIDFELLYKIFSQDEKLFTQIYPKLIVSEKPAIMILSELLHSFKGDASGIMVTETMCTFLKNLGEARSKVAQEIIFLLKNFSVAERAITYGYTPYAHNLDMMSDAVGFPVWFFENKEALVKKLAVAETVSSHLFGSKSQALQEALTVLLAKHGEEFLKNFTEIRSYNESRTISDDAYMRIADLFASLVNPKRLLRRREITIMLQYFASISALEVWNDFCIQFIQVGGDTVGAYDRLFEKYRCDIVLKYSEAKCDMEGLRILVETFLLLDADKQRTLLDRFAVALSAKTVSPEVVEEICLRIRKKHYALTDYALTQIEAGVFPAEIMETIKRYANDEEFRNSPPR